MFRIIRKYAGKVCKSFDLVKNERGSLDIFTTKLGLAVVSVIAVVLLIAAVRVAVPDLWDWFINGMKGAFTF